MTYFDFFVLQSIWSRPQTEEVIKGRHNRRYLKKLEMCPQYTDAPAHELVGVEAHTHGEPVVRRDDIVRSGH